MQERDVQRHLNNSRKLFRGKKFAQAWQTPVGSVTGMPRCRSCGGGVDDVLWRRETGLTNL